MCISKRESAVPESVTATDATEPGSDVTGPAASNTLTETGGEDTASSETLVDRQCVGLGEPVGGGTCRDGRDRDGDS